MANTRKQAQKHNNGGSKSKNKTTKVQQKGRPNPKLDKGTSMADSDDVSEHSINPENQSDDFNQILTPKSSLRDLQQQSQIRGDFNAWLSGLHSGKDVRTHFSHSNIGGNTLFQSMNDDDNLSQHNAVILDDNVVNTVSSTQTPIVQIEFDDIKDEIAYWESAVICYMIGANPPQNVMEGYVRRIWGKYGVDKVSQVGRGIYMVRFTTMENCSKVLQGGYQFFDSKPLVVKPWSADVNFSKDPVKKLPIWIQLHGLDVKYWGEKSLGKIVSQLGSLIKVDQATKNRDKLMFARVMIEVQIDQEFPNVIHFRNEIGIMVSQQVNYDWLPITCSVCKGMGHTHDHCSKKQTGNARKIWVKKATQPVTAPVPPPVPLGDGFVQATKFSKTISRQLKPVVTANSFQTLSDSDTEVVHEEKEVLLSTVSPSDRGVTSPLSNG